MCYSLEDVICLMFPSDSFIVHAFDVYCAGERNDPTSDMFQVQILVESLNDDFPNSTDNNNLLTQVDPDQDIAHLLEALSFQDKTPSTAVSTTNDTLYSSNAPFLTTAANANATASVGNASSAVVSSFAPDKMVRSVHELFV
ncbi:unnamed protein product [Ambrosiozyma monospora]|uniref:Unnamed protein product n=1 Tax=Ambrosiozyma monospora TaxID=43982 RepID=A0ACB5TPF1_AMBMO|nr:unnamed protein product [Ambrosiozyma monospora]